MSLFFKFRSARGSGSGGGGGGGGGAACRMECSVAAGGGALPAHPAPAPAQRSPAKTGLHVNFTDKGEVKERREKFLTAKYGSHQMALIRKRLAVEMWLYDELQKLFELPRPEGGGGGGAEGGGGQEMDVDIDELLDMDSEEHRRAHLKIALSDKTAFCGGGGGGAEGGGGQEVDVDIDELLDMDSEEHRRAHLKKLLVDAKKPSRDVNKFINELLEKAKTL